MIDTSNWQTSRVEYLNIQRIIVEKSRARNRYYTDDFPETRYALSDNQVAIYEQAKLCPWATHYANIPAQAIENCPWYITYNGERVENGYLDTVLNMIKPVYGDQMSLRKKSIRLQTMLGMHLVALRAHPATGNVRYDVVHPMAARYPSQDHRQAFDIYEAPQSFYAVPRDAIGVNGLEDDVYANLTRSPLEPVLQMMTMYNVFVQALHRKGLMSKSLPQLFSVEHNSYGDDSGGHATQTQIDEVNEYVRRAVHSSVEGLPVSPMFLTAVKQLHKADLVDEVQEHDIELLAGIIKLACVSLDVPASWFVHGEGGLPNRWNDREAVKGVLTTYIRPQIKTNDSFWTEFALQRIIKALQRDQNTPKLLEGTRVDGWKLETDLSSLETRDVDVSYVMEAEKSGLIKKNSTADVLGLPSPEPETQPEIEQEQEPEQLSQVDKLLQYANSEL